MSVCLFLFVPWSAAEYPWERTPVSAAPWFLMRSILPQFRGGLQVTNGDLLSRKSEGGTKEGTSLLCRGFADAPYLPFFGSNSIFIGSEGMA